MIHSLTHVIIKLFYTPYDERMKKYGVQVGFVEQLIRKNWKHRISIFKHLKEGILFSIQNSVTCLQSIGILQWFGTKSVISLKVSETCAVLPVYPNLHNLAYTQWIWMEFRYFSHRPISQLCFLSLTLLAPAKIFQL